MSVELRPMEDQAPDRQAALRESRGATCSEFWECRACGQECPCKVEIVYTKTQHAHVEQQPRFTEQQRCICGERVAANWQQIQNGKDETHDDRIQ